MLIFGPMCRTFFVRVTPDSARPTLGVAAGRVEEGFYGRDAGGYNAYGSF